MPRLTIAQAQDMVAQTLERCRTGPDNARCVARALVAAEADGLTGHGLSRLPSYAAQAKAGKVDGFAVPQTRRPRPGAAMIDAGHGFAFPAIALAESILPEMARSAGIACAGITRSHHCGAAGHPVERLAQAGLVAMLFANTPGAIAPWGGAKPAFGTNPIAFACPLPGAPPIVVDLSLSKVARGNILAARQKGERIPMGWALDASGAPTSDPDAALAGTMLPLGDAKGTALALMVELLAAGLTGANYAAEASSFLDAQGPPPGTGQLIIAIDPDAFDGGLAHFARLAAMIEAQPGARLPGARRLAARAAAQRDGLAVGDALLREIAAL
jgi:(2R)-3-sulfolactate dehydrogenase (NADP+)